MSLLKHNNVAIKLDNIASASVSNALIPVMTKQGIQIGSYVIKPTDGQFIVKRKNEELYKTFTKSAAMIIAGLLNKNKDRKHIRAVLDADTVANSSKNDLTVFRYHHDIATKNGDDTKKYIMEARFECANQRYQEAKKILKQSYIKLF